MSKTNLVHLKAPDCWINDPNGFIYFKGMYHLFYQCFPYSTQWGRMHWGHAVSKDLVHWEHKGIALYPSKTDDRSGCFSGSAVEHDGKMHLIYTGVNYMQEDPENINTCLNDRFQAAQLMITSENGITFDNLADKKTIIPPIEIPHIGSKTHTRDPKVWSEKDTWYMVLGSSVEEKGRLLFYRSKDLEHWEYVSHAEKENFGWMWECPDYFEIDGQKVLIFSPMGFLKESEAYDSAAICMLPEFELESCTMHLPDEFQFLDYGLDLYAPQSATDAEGRRVLVAWARMPEAVDGKWNGMFCIPRIVEVKNGHIYFRPHPNMTNQFTKKITSPLEAGKGGYKISVDMHEGSEINIGGYRLLYHKNRVYADRSAVFAGHNEIRCQFETPEIREGSHLDIYVDQNLIEVYINDGEYVLSNVVYSLSNEIQAENYELFTTEN